MDSSEPELIRLPCGMARVEWRRSPRARRVSLRIDPCIGAVVVTLPMRAARAAGMSLLMDNVEWLSTRLARLPEAVPFTEGAEIPIDGTLYRIRHLPGARGGVWLDGSYLCVSGKPEFMRRRVTDYLRREARSRLMAMVAEKAGRIGATPKRLTLRDTRTRWGSCASDGSLSFCWRLVMAPPFVQDYVAAHEVAHLKHMNHGKRFWALVAKLTPHTEAAIAWLRQEGSRLLRTG
jgi:predicted metal-dependent hydrolase